MQTSSCTSAVLCGNTTASGGSFAIQVVVLACCSRTAREVTSRLPNFAVRAVIAEAVALELRVPPALVSSTAMLRSHQVRHGITIFQSRTHSAGQRVANGASRVERLAACLTARARACGQANR